jgi:energy-coupling factor transport system permease protein
MLKNITLGQYFPGDTVVHRLDPRVKLVLTAVYIAALFVAKSYVSYALMLAVIIACVYAAKLRFKMILKGIKPILFIIVFTAVLNIFFAEGTPVFTIWKLTVTYEGLEKAFFMVMRLIMLITGTFMLTYTTSPVALTDGLESLLRPLKKIKVPVHEISMIMSIALRFIPLFIEETDRIMSAQRARGANFDTGGILKRARAMLAILIPLFLSAFRRADELAVAMESRCYHGGEGRTRMKRLSMAGIDFAAVSFGALVLAATITLAVFGL